MPLHPGPLGWIEPKDRTAEQTEAHESALQKRLAFALQPAKQLAKGEKIILTDVWKHPKVIADLVEQGYKDLGPEGFTGFHQLTGSCVGVSEGNALVTLSGVQRLLSELGLKGTPTKAFIPWWAFPYGTTRRLEGDRGPGEGAVCSIMDDALTQHGYFGAIQPGLPDFRKDDGWYLTEQIEMQWSAGDRSPCRDQKWVSLAAEHKLGGAATLNSIEDVRTAILNGYPVYNGCEYYVGNGRLTGSGEWQYVQGKYDGRGGHATCYLGHCEHPNDGPLYLYSNQWPTQTYPKDPLGGARCTVWLTEREASRLFQLGGGNGETFAMSHLDYLPAQPDVPDVFMWF